MRFRKERVQTLDVELNMTSLGEAFRHTLIMAGIYIKRG